MSPATPPVDTVPARERTTASPATKALGCTQWRADVHAAVKKEETAPIVAFATVAQVEKPCRALFDLNSEAGEPFTQPPNFGFLMECLGFLVHVNVTYGRPVMKRLD